jgi:hypothetical protein
MTEPGIEVFGIVKLSLPKSAQAESEKCRKNPVLIV